MAKQSKAPLSAESALTLLGEVKARTDEWRYACRLVTPMYGGGVKAGEVDLAMPIRATAIRGQLREWWRRLNSKHFASDKAMFEAERAIWGGLGDADALAASKVAVIVHAPAATSRNLRNIARFEQRDGRTKGPFFEKGLPSYALFPGQGKSERGQVTEPPKQLLDEGFSFVISLRFIAALSQPQRDQVMDALRWWSTFGGVGARNRRGCGAVLVTDAAGKLICVGPDEVEKHGWTLKLRGSHVQAMTAWEDAVGALRDFRQKEGLARNPGKQQSRPGRSRWPEPDAIRRITGKNDPQHKPYHPAGNVFPRAAFGLPIIFHFKDERTGDPMDSTLKPVPNGKGDAAERMASPLILRPYSRDGKLWRAAALCMELEHVEAMGLSLEGRDRSLPKTLTPGTWIPDTSAAAEITPLAGKTGAIEAFLEYFGNARQAMPPGRTTPARPSSARGVAGVQVSLRPNGSLIALHKHTKGTWSVVAAKVEGLLADLPTALRESLQAGQSVTCDIEVVGYDVIKLREKA